MHDFLIRWFPNLYMRGRIFSDRRWSRVAPMMNAGVSKFGTAVTITGTLLLWSNSFHATAEGIKSVAARVGFKFQEGWFDTSTRLMFIYYGGVLLLVAWAIYKVRCPEIIQRRPLVEDFLREQQQVLDNIGYAQAEARASTFVIGGPQAAWSTSAPMGVARVMTPGELNSALRSVQALTSRSTIFRAVHIASQVDRPFSFLLCVLLGTVGFLLAATPSIEVFLLVTRRAFA